MHSIIMFSITRGKTGFCCICKVIKLSWAKPESLASHRVYCPSSLQKKGLGAFHFFVKAGRQATIVAKPSMIIDSG